MGPNLGLVAVGVGHYGVEFYREWNGMYVFVDLAGWHTKLVASEEEYEKRRRQILGLDTDPSE